MGTMKINFTLIVQLLNTGIIIGLIFAVYYLAIKLPRKLKEREQRLNHIEKVLNEINKKIDNI